MRKKTQISDIVLKSFPQTFCPGCLLKWQRKMKPQLQYPSLCPSQRNKGSLVKRPVPGMKSISQFSHLVVSDSLQPHGLQHARPPCPSSTPGVYSNSCPLSWWCHPTISSSVVPFSSRFQPFTASGPLPMSQLFASCDQCIRVSASASVLPKNIQDWFPLGWTGWISSQY